MFFPRRLLVAFFVVILGCTTSKTLKNQSKTEMKAFGDSHISDEKLLKQFSQSSFKSDPIDLSQLNLVKFEKPNFQLRRLHNSSGYFLLAEAAMKENSFDDALALYGWADRENPDNLYIKESIMELLSYLSSYNESYVEDLISYGEEYLEQDVYNEKILLPLAKGYTHNKQTELANQVYQRLINEFPDLVSYLMFYSFKKDILEETDTTLLIKASEYSPEEPNEALILINYLKEIDLTKSVSVLQESYSKWHDEQILISLLSLYEEEKDVDMIISTLDSALESDYIKSIKIKEYYINLLFREKKFSKIVEHKDLCYELETERSLKQLFYSSMAVENYELALHTGLKLESIADLSNKTISSFYVHFSQTWYYLQNDAKFIEYLLKSNDYKLIAEIFLNLFDAAENQNKKDRILNLLDEYIQLSPEKKQFYPIAVAFYSLHDDTVKLKYYMEKISTDFIIENDLINMFVSIYLDKFHDVRQAKKMLDLRKEKDFPTSELIFLAFYQMENPESAVDLTIKELKKQNEVSAKSYNLAGMVFQNANAIEPLVSYLGKAIEKYPEDTTLLNFLGYAIAQHDIKDKFSYAENLLQKAIKNEPDNMGIWDSLSWLYYKQGKYEKAISVMKPFLDERIEFSEIAYHIGEIYLKLGKLNKAKQYFQNAIDLNDDEKYVHLSKTNLDRIN